MGAVSTNIGEAGMKSAALRARSNGMRTCVLFLWVLLSGCVLPLQAQTIEYVHTDALGTPVAITNAAGQVIERSEYEPYGKLLNRPLTDGPGFTGHVQDAATGLTYMQQRYYDPGIGRFLSVDPVTAYGGDIRFFNRYAYAFNNPYKFTDPDGRCPPCAAAAAVLRRMAVGAAIGAGVNTGVQMAMGEGTLKQRFSQVDGNQVKVAAVAGAASGGVSAIASTAKTVGGTILANGIGNAGIGASATQASALVDGKVASAGETLTGAAVSGLTAVAGSAIEALGGVLSRLPSAGMSQTERVATDNLLTGVKNTTPGFTHSNPIQTGANAVGAGVSSSGDLAPIIKEEKK